MAWLGNSDSTGDGSGCTFYSLAADITGMSAAGMGRFKVGARAQAQDTGKNYVLLLAANGTRTWQLQD